MQARARERIFGLDVMRALAILLVVFSHISWIIPNAQGIVIDLMGIAGVFGVEIFFCLSGFLIGRIIYKLYLSKDVNFKSVAYFWVRRWFRTLPNYYLALLINIAVTLFIGLNVPANIWSYFVFLQNFSSEMPLFFVESWSLSVEEFAYILGPLLLFCTLFIKTKIAKQKMFLYVTLFILVCFLITKWFYAINDNINNMSHWNTNLKAVVIYRIDAIYYGVLAAYVSIVKPVFWRKSKYYMVLISLVLLFTLNIIAPLANLFIETNPLFWNFWYLPLYSIAIAFSLPFFSQWKKSPKIIGKPIVYISLISYSVYVFHYSIILQIMKFYWPTENLPRLDICIYIVTYLSITFLCSYIVYSLFEKPMTALRDHPKIKSFFN